ncbi:MAG: chalcone isomerase family protein [bacterium]|nr:MAG: chalcone isomerase family protein [bacterium]
MKRNGVLVLVLVLAMFAAPPAAPAAEMGGVTVQDTISIGSSTARLAGLGFRKKFVIKVYMAGLYMAEPELSQGSIIASDQAKAVFMHFVYGKVEAAKLQEAWREGFEKNTPGAGADLRQRMDRFVGLFREDALRGDEYLLAYEPGVGTRIILKGQEVDTIPGADFASAMMAIWFGDYPADAGLKKNILAGQM